MDNNTYACTELNTVIIHRNTSRTDFKFYADRLIRLVIEESLNQLPFNSCMVMTPTGTYYKGTKYQRGNCGVSIVRSGEAMEQVRVSYYLYTSSVSYSFNVKLFLGFARLL